eukprot:Em0020g1088a
MVRGVSGPQGYKCLTCDFATHRRCLEYVPFICPGTSLPEGIEPKPHKLTPSNYYHPTWCDHCGGMLYGLFNQGTKCADCGLNFHHRCQKQVPKSCGIQRERHGRIKLSIKTEKIDTNMTRLHIRVLEARNLPPMDANGLADPYVKLLLFPEDSGRKQKTERKEKTLNPVFDEDFFFDVSNKDKTSKQLRLLIEVWDWDRFLSNDYMGGFSIPVQQIEEETKGGVVITNWYKMFGADQAKDCYERIVADEDVEKLVQEFRQETLVERKLKGSGGDDPASMLTLRRGSEMVPESKTLPKMSLEDFTLLVVLGKGSFGKVFLAEHKSTKEVYAVKSLKKDVIVQEDDVECTLNERRVLALQHKPPFLTRLHSCFQTRDHLFFVMEYISGGDLMFHMLEQGKFPESQARFYLAEIVVGLLYLHKMGIIYRDIKLDNIMLDEEGHIKIADFGLCKEGISNGAKTKTFCGTPDYIAPEIISYQPYDSSVDWWALGVLGYEMLVGRPPFDGEDDDQLFNSIMEKSVNYPKSLSEPAKLLLQGFLVKHPARRLGCNPATGGQDIKEHVFFQPIDWAKLEQREIKPPFKPKNKGKKSVTNFDVEFTKEPCRLSVVDQTVVTAIEPEVFDGFSFTNPELYMV